MVPINLTNAITGRNNDLYNRIKAEINGADEIKFLVSFIRESGAFLIADDLKKAALKGARIKILTSDYLNITEPAALYLLKDKLGKLAEIRMIDLEEIPFHPKAYFFRDGEKKRLYIGSSNLSYSALNHSIEWNYKLEEEQDPQAFEEFTEDFNDLFENNSIELTDQLLREYASGWKKHELIKIVEDEEDELLGDGKDEIKPRGAQHEALYELELAREEGVEKGLVAAATGVGKTYLAAFDSLQYDKALFVAHREEILRQARDSYQTIEPDRNYTFFNGQEKDASGDVVFASVQTLRKEKYLNKYFEPDTFDYIVVDEFHHAAADSYLNVLDYFEPEFLLGLTATPYRMDNQDVFALCNDNLIYEIDLKSAINRDLLVPFKYYGIYDPEVDYEDISTSQGKYVVKELEEKLSTHRRGDLVYKNYRRLGGESTLGFCASIAHARYMANYFNRQKGVKAATVHSSPKKGEFFMDREEAVISLKNGDIDIIFAVDIFNEGVDIPVLDTVLFLRPTESYVVFLQQLGRGLRKYQGKDHLKVIDFIGNYKRAHYLPYLLAGVNPLDRDYKKGERLDNLEYPENCEINIDFEAIDLFEEMKKNDPLEKRMADEYYRLKESLGRRPLRYDIYTGSDLDTKDFIRRKYNDVKGYLRFLNDLDELNSEEENWLGTIAEEFLIELEKTSMTKSYKMPVLLALVQKDKLQQSVSLKKVGESFMDFYKNNKQHQKDLNNKRHKNWQNWDLEKFIKEAVRNPVKFLSKREFFIHDEINKEFRLHDDLAPYLTDCLKEHLLDIIKYRKTRYFKRRFK
ncbi:DEAD/DEAH box helicase family protein [Halanaerobiaceae bacterium Z-7014]|uniref:DEAD/DEAH box helicase family protein n=1 Tax=Halonatronomonas betaini TaxID=2778430 RepID=A0A931F8Z8_9FIRM|nr:DEAD/DEAH box helicase family protein [Halonatronomonas betaini]MBF8435522.1 DEAD/DEAH box helicase family protein [Halonatronomonas betaini]